MKMINSIEYLNWFIFVYIVISIIGYESIINAKPSLRILFALIPIALLLWQILILEARFQETPKDPALPLYESFKAEDGFRIFFILWIGQGQFASHYIWGFYLFSSIVIIIFVFLVYSASVELYRKRTVTLLVIGCLTFAFFLLSWEKNMYVIYYGVPIIGNFFEKPEYNAKYRVEIKSDDSDRKYTVTADIHVEESTETNDDGGGDGLFEPILPSTTTYRNIWINRLYFPNGGSVGIEDQDEPLHMGDDPVSISDSSGRTWEVELLHEPILYPQLKLTL